MLENDPTVQKALEVVRDAGNDGILPYDYALAMWPQSPVWKGRGRNGMPTSPRRIVAAAGGMLGRLRAEGLTKRWGDGRYARHFLTPLGEQFLASARERAKYEAR